MIKYIAIFFDFSSNTLKEIQHLSNSKIRMVNVNGSTTVSFDSPMTLNELDCLFSNDPSNIYIITELDKLKIGFPQEITELLMGELEVSDIQNESIIKFTTDDDFEQFFTNSEILSTIPEPQAYVDSLTEESKQQKYSELVNKLPNVTEWEAKVIKLLSLDDI